MNYPVWHDNKGDPITCIEKIKVMEENIDELSLIAIDLVDDAVLMGISEQQIKDFLSDLIQSLTTRF